MEGLGGISVQCRGLSPCRPWVDGDGMLVEAMEVLGNRWKQGRVSERKKKGTRLLFLIAKHRHSSWGWTLGGSRRPCPDLGGTMCLRVGMGPPTLLAYMALFEHKYGID